MCTLSSNPGNSERAYFFEYERRIEAYSLRLVAPPRRLGVRLLVQLEQEVHVLKCELVVAPDRRQQLPVPARAGAVLEPVHA